MSVAAQFVPQAANSAEALSRNGGAALPADPLASAISGIIHDFNNLITGILLYAELLSNELHPHSRSHHHVEQIRKAAQDSAALIRQLLAIAHPEPESDPQPRSSWNLSINESLDLLQKMAGENIEIATELAEHLDPVQLGPTRMQQILLNLVLNARDAMPDGGRILIQTSNASGIRRHGTDFVDLSVSDNGVGMSAEVASSLFEPYRTTKKNGSGLGLFTVRRLVRQCGGQVRVETGPRKGTRVTIQLPRAVQHTEEPECQAKEVKR